MSSKLYSSYPAAPVAYFINRHLLTNNVPIDINILCDAIDFLCGAAVLVRKDFVLHNVTLPRSWFITLLRRIKRDTFVPHNATLPQSWFTTLLGRIKRDAKRSATFKLNFLLISVKLLVERLQSGVSSGWFQHTMFNTASLTPCCRSSFVRKYGPQRASGDPGRLSHSSVSVEKLFIIKYVEVPLFQMQGNLLGWVEVCSTSSSSNKSFEQWVTM